MNALRSIFAWLGRFLDKARAIMLNLGTAIVLIFFTVLIIGALTSTGPKALDPSGRVLFIDPQGIVVDQEVFGSDFLTSLAAGPSSDQIQARDLVKLIRAVADHESIPAVFIDFSSTGFAGPTTAINIAKELKALRESGKRVIAYSDLMTTSSYLMASQASEVWVHPVGSVSVQGLGGVRPYQKELFENLKINFHNYSQGDFKSAVEGNTRTEMSENDRLQREALLNPIWGEMKSLMAEGRGIKSSDVQAFADNMAELDDYQVEYYGQKLSPEELIIKELLENFDISVTETKVLSALDGIANLYETLAEIQQPKALFTCQDCMIDLD